MKITLIPIFEDNYVFHGLTNDGISFVVDPGDAKPVKEFLQENNYPLNIILHTHHHWDHINGDKELQDTYNCEIWGPEYEIMRIPNMDVLLQDEQEYTLGTHQFRVIHTPGHTRGHICLYFQDDKILFAGDTLFSLGCGRLFEGTPEEMWDSLQKIRKLPSTTKIYCAHEYTHNNAKFWKSIEPNNPNIETVIANLNTPTIPTNIAFEKKHNPFLRVDCPRFTKNIGQSSLTPNEVFQYIRELKDRF